MRIGIPKLIEDKEDRAINKGNKEEEPVRSNGGSKDKLKQMSGGDSKRKMLNILNVFYIIIKL